MPAGRFLYVAKSKKQLKAKKSNPSNKRIAKIAKNVLMRNSETKVFRVSATTTVQADSDNVNLIANQSRVIEGAGPEERIGNSINPIGFKLKLLIDSPVEDMYLRVAVISCSEDDFTTGTELLLANDGTGLTPVVGTTSDILRDFNPKVRVLMDRTFYLQDGTSNPSNDPLRPRKFVKYIKLKQGKRTFSEPTSDESDKHNIRLVYMARQQGDATTAGSDVEIRNISEYYYKDL